MTPRAAIALVVALLLPACATVTETCELLPARKAGRCAWSRDVAEAWTAADEAGSCMGERDGRPVCCELSPGRLCCVEAGEVECPP